MYMGIFPSAQPQYGISSKSSETKEFSAKIAKSWSAGFKRYRHKVLFPEWENKRREHSFVALATAQVAAGLGSIGNRVCNILA